MIEQIPFWNYLRQLTRIDTSRDVSEATTARARAIFQPSKPIRYLRLQPAMTGMVRQATIQNKFLYQTNGDFVVQLEANPVKRHWQLGGILLDTKGPFTITLFGVGILEEVAKVEDQFLFNDLTPGQYRLCFEQGGATFWIKSLIIGNKPQGPRPA